MTKRGIRVLMILGTTLLAGCVLNPQKPSAPIDENRSTSALATGIAEYEDGKYPEASRDIQSALDKGLQPADQVMAHKYLAFIHCVSSRERLCRDEFRKALEISPAMELAPAEAGHPIWGPVFRSVKGKKADAKK